MPESPPQDKREPPRQRQLNWRFLIVIGVCLSLTMWLLQSLPRLATHTIAYSQFKAFVARGEVIRCNVQADEVTGQIHPPAAAPPPAAPATALAVPLP